jgi:hypothetical protein
VNISNDLRSSAWLGDAISWLQFVMTFRRFQVGFWSSSKQFKHPVGSRGAVIEHGMEHQLFPTLASKRVHVPHLGLGFVLLLATGPTTGLDVLNGLIPLF